MKLKYLREGIVHTPDSDAIRKILYSVLVMEKERITKGWLTSPQLASRFNKALAYQKELGKHNTNIIFYKSERYYNWTDDENSLQWKGLDGAAADYKSDDSGQIVIFFTENLVYYVSSDFGKKMFINRVMSYVDHELVHIEQFKKPSLNLDNISYHTPKEDEQGAPLPGEFQKYASQGVELVAWAKQVVTELLVHDTAEAVLHYIKAKSNMRSLAQGSRALRMILKNFDLESKEYRKFLTYLYSYLKHEVDKKKSKLTEGIVRIPDSSEIRETVRNTLYGLATRATSGSLSSDKVATILNKEVAPYNLIFVRSKTKFKKSNDPNSLQFIGLDGGMLDSDSNDNLVIEIYYTENLVLNCVDEFSIDIFIKALMPFIDHELVHIEQFNKASLSNKSLEPAETFNKKTAKKGDIKYYTTQYDASGAPVPNTYKKYATQGIELVAHAQQAVTELLSNLDKDKILKLMASTKGYDELCYNSEIFAHILKATGKDSKEFKKYLRYIFAYLHASKLP